MKDTIREIRRTLSRFLSIFAIILIGVAFFAGLVASGPVMDETANYYFEKQSLADMEVMSTVGLTDQDISDIEKMTDGTIETRSMVDVLIGENQATRLFGYDETNELNQFEVIDGRLPEQNNEIALDNTDEMSENYDIGDTVELVTQTSENYLENITEESFEVVGFIQSPHYIEHGSRGATNIGTGSLSAFGVVMEDVIDLDDNLVYVSFDESNQFDSVYSDDYEAFMDSKVTEYEDTFDGRAKERKDELVKEAEQELESGRTDIEDAKKELEDAKNELDEAKEKIDSGKEELDTQQEELNQASQLFGPNSPQIVQGQTQIDEARNQLEESEIEYKEALEEFEEEEQQANEDISEAEKELADGEEDLADLKAMTASMNFTSALDYPGLSEYGENAERIEAIAKVFPVFFFALALLVSLTTMSRMVDEGRTQVGTMKALGYNNRDIGIKYFTYALIATVLGSVVGLAIGFPLFPWIIVDAYSLQYSLASPQLGFYPVIAAIAFIGAILSTSLATFISLRSLLKNNAATLLRPKAPKSGQRILLERISWFWNTLSFTRKVSIRNLFRYKGRMFMTIIGVAGGVALMLTGFGLSDSIEGIGNKQFNELYNYESISVVDTDAGDEAVEEVDKALADMLITDNFLRMASKTVTIGTEEGSQDVTVTVPENSENLADYINLVDYEDTTEILPLVEGSALITQKVSELANIKEGDVLTIEDEDGDTYEVTIGGIVEHYVDHNLYMLPDYYQETFDSEPEYDTRLIKYADNSVSRADESIFEEELSQMNASLGVVLHSDNLQTVEDSLSSLETVTVVLIISAGTLAFVVLYNLTNINVSERIKELSTIKVLGFYDKEVTRYVYRETFTLTVLGIIVGLFLGILLHSFIIMTVELDYLMFSRSIQPTSYLMASVLMFIFSTLVMILMHFKLKKVNMVEALKAND